MKLLILFNVFFVLLFVTFSQGANFTDCQMERGDHELYTYDMLIQGTIGEVLKAYVAYPPTGPPKYVVNCIEAIDHAKDQQDEGTVSIWQGAIGEKYVELQIESQPGGSLNFTIFFYGH